MAIAIVDYGMGNLRSVQKAFESNGAKARVTSSVAEIKRAEKIVLPGVGAFTAAASELEKRKLMGVIRKRIEAGVPYLGLCLGLQLLFSESEESEGKKKARGLGLIPGCVKRFRGRMKIPHMGWNNVRPVKKNCPLFKGLSGRDYFYFVHSYYGSPTDTAWTAGETHYGIDFCSAVWKDNVFATQFHPEKSQAAGLKLIQNFIRWTC